ncbi:MAG: transcription elongation factor GreA [Christensenellales bacterium]|jgi:transcription elongation factor GreA|nr:transcription elongation factor GreA [Clostridiales bacterium]
MEKNIPLTQEFFDELKEKLRIMQTDGRTKVADALQAAISFGDLSENAEYTDAKAAQEKLEIEIMKIEALLDKAYVIDKSLISLSKVGFGNKVKIEDLIYKDVEEYTIVSAAEGDINRNKLAADSPMGAALMGAKKGEVVQYNAPGGLMKVKVLEISR